MDEPFFIPEGTSLHSLLAQFRRSRQRTAFVVDEYGNIQGLVTIEDLLEEILGEFSSSGEEVPEEVRREEKSDAWLVSASINVRALNRMMTGICLQDRTHNIEWTHP